jgi:hypothetical protein
LSPRTCDTSGGSPGAMDGSILHLFFLLR